MRRPTWHFVAREMNRCKIQSGALVHFNPVALLVFVAFCALLLLLLSAGSNATRAAEALVTVLIAIGVGGLALRGGHKTRR
jgi:hypothetical protein